ncbi:hypothetical protein F4803DRAFT_541770 [Xylaria telfairii]|nr:hypothetical protein F4803DRAFT_541770 [Xylaria telfairii]
MPANRHVLILSEWLDTILAISKDEIKHLLLLEILRMEPQVNGKTTITQPSESYSYPTLPNELSATRLVILVRSKRKHSDIVCKLCHDSLDGNKYEAVSDVWGHASRTKVIAVNDEPLKLPSLWKPRERR